MSDRVGGRKHTHAADQFSEDQKSPLPEWDFHLRAQWHALLEFAIGHPFRSSCVSTSVPRSKCEIEPCFKEETAVAVDRVQTEPRIIDQLSHMLDELLLAGAVDGWFKVVFFISVSTQTNDQKGEKGQRPSPTQDREDAVKMGHETPLVLQFQPAADAGSEVRRRPGFIRRSIRLFVSTLRGGV